MSVCRHLTVVYHKSGRYHSHIEDLSRIVVGPIKTEAKETKGVQLEDKLKLNNVLTVGNAMLTLKIPLYTLST